MREAIGGSWLLGFVVLFIVLFSGYLAVSINYTKAFKVKNEILDIIEECEGYTTSPDQNWKTLSNSELEAKDDARSRSLAVIKSMGYYTEDSDTCNDKQGEYQYGGYCVNHICTKRGNYYRVTTFIKFEIPFLDLNIKIPITGETPIIYYDNGACL